MAPLARTLRKAHPNRLATLGRLLPLVLGWALLHPSPAAASTFTVDSTGDGADTVINGTCQASGPAPNCTLRAAIQEALASGAPRIVNFNISGASPYTVVLGSDLPTITLPLTIDGTTQTGWAAGAPVIELNGAGATTTGVLTLGAGSSGSTVRGLIINRCTKIAIRVFSSNNVIAGNFLGTNAAGTAAAGNAVGVYVGGGSNNQIDGTTAAGRNVISGNTVDGIQIEGSGGTNANIVRGNYIGLDAAGNGIVANSSKGVAIYNNSPNNVVGGPGAGNVISGNGTNGIAVAHAGSTGTVIRGNLIGTDSGGTLARGNGARGISLEQSSANARVGGTGAGEGNTIAHNGDQGISVDPTSVGNAILGNKIFDNGTSTGALGIDLNVNWVDLNDTGDGDTGANNTQNHPVLSAAMTNGGGAATIAGSLNSTPNQSYRIELFANAALHASGYGEGERYLGATKVTTDVNGNAVFGVTLAPVVLNAGEFVTGTATFCTDGVPCTTYGDTSEFGGGVQAVSHLVVTTTADSTTGSDTSSVSNLIANPGSDGRISFREAILATNNTAGPDTITFGIPIADGGHVYYQDDGSSGTFGAPTVTWLADQSTPSSPTIPAAAFDADYPPGMARSWYQIQVTSQLPIVTSPVLLDATTQPLSIPARGPVVELDGTGAGAASGLVISAGGSTVRGLVIDRFQQHGIVLQTGAGNTIAGNIIGLNVAGTAGLGNGGQGVRLVGSNGNVVGGTSAADRNVISLSGTFGIYIDATSQNELIQGNYIGTDVTGTSAVGNTLGGMRSDSNAGPSTIGGTVAGAGNLISGNGQVGVSISGSANGFVLQGNQIGTDVTGLLNLGNGQSGIQLAGGSSHVVGGTSASARNVICGNGGNGMLVPAGATGVTIRGNYIGVGADGATKIANSPNGIDVTGTGTVIGGTAAGAGNVISGNTQAGIFVNAASGVVVQGNAIGTDATRTVAVGNQDGIWLGNGGTSNSLVGGTTAAAANLIAYNTRAGIATGATAGSGNSILGNSIYLNNGGLGIDLLNDGVTLNDDLDPDTGPNDLLNYPTLGPPVEGPVGTLTVNYALNVPAGYYRVEFFQNPVGADPSGYGEGQSLASAVVVSHPLLGRTQYSTTLSGSAGDVITATATVCTDGTLSCTAPGSTSEFSPAVLAVTTAVELMSFTATGADGAVLVEWKTASELNNLGFLLYRSLSEAGPWTRITPSLIAGLGSSPVGASYSWTDGGLTNGTRYDYRLEDIDGASRSTFHGPVSAVPQASSSGKGDGGADPGSGGTGETGSGSGETGDGGALETYGDPSGISLRVVSRTAREAVVELLTPGFYASRDTGGHVRVSIPGFDLPSDPHAPALPFRRVLLDALVGRQVRLASVKEGDEVRFAGLVPAAVGYPEMQVGADGTVRPARRAASLRIVGPGPASAEPARISGVAFEGESKKAVLELAPLRYDAGKGELVLERRLVVTVAFEGLELRETGTGTRGRRAPRSRPGSGGTLVFLYATQRGLHAVSYESLFPGRRRALAVGGLALERQGAPVPFHVEPATGIFGPGSRLYFYVEGGPSSTAYTGEVAYELLRQAGGVEMATASVAPTGEPLAMPSMGRSELEVNRLYQSGLLEAKDPWLWEAVLGGQSRSEGFALSGVDPTAAGHLSVFLQGGSDAGGVVDHHVRIRVNGSFVAEARFDAKAPYQVQAEVGPSVLREGENTLTVENAGDTGVYSLVFLDRFEVAFPQSASLRGGVFEGVWPGSGVVTVSGASSPIALDVTDPGAPVWLSGYETDASAVRLEAEAGHRDLLVSPEAVLEPRIAAPVRSSLLSGTNQADYIVIAPDEFLPAAQPLLERRQAQGLTARAVGLGEIASVFGHGDPSGEAIHSFLVYAFHSWAAPSPRYVLLLGDSSSDPRDFTGTAQPAPLPALWTKTSYLWTVSDPALAAVNGDDALPDLAIGRLPATTLEQAQALVAKVLDWEDSGQGLGGAAVLVADNPDPAGDFEADVDDIRSSFLSGRPTTTIKLRELGALTRPAILEAFDRGASLMSYVGHGGAAVWASENVLNSWDVDSLQAQSEQPLMLTMNCLNGYFVAPNFESLSEAFLKAQGRGTIAAISPSGLSIDGPAHVLHRALMAEIGSSRYTRLGDAFLAAQEDYANSGEMPELLTIYHLLGDPATKIR
jgi:hypothetical protein